MTARDPLKCVRKKLRITAKLIRTYYDEWQTAIAAFYSLFDLL